jgi:hypothetical protein
VNTCSGSLNEFPAGSRPHASPETASLHSYLREAGLMTAATVRTQPSGVADGLEVPRPLRLLLTVGWSLGESVGLPVAAYTVAAWPGGRDASLTAGLVAIWLTAGIRKAATGSAPSLLTISAAVLTLQTTVVLATGELWLFLLQFPLPNQCMRVVSARTAAGSNPLVARLAADVAALRQPDITPACTASPRGRPGRGRPSSSHPPRPPRP